MDARQWVANFTENPDRPQIGRVQTNYGDGFIDVVVYSIAGENLGRVTPACGGPEDFEPCLCAADWDPIEAPDFGFVKKRTHYGQYLRRLSKQQSREICAACGSDDYEGELTLCPYCGSTKCAFCDMGNDVECAACENKED